MKIIIGKTRLENHIIGIMVTMPYPPYPSNGTGMFTDPSFTGSAASVDKRGRKVRFNVNKVGITYILVLIVDASLTPVKQVKKTQRKENMTRYYRLDNQDVKKENEEEQKEEEEVEEDSDEASLRWARMRGLVGPDSSSGDEDEVEEQVEVEDEDESEENRDNEEDEDLEEEEELEAAAQEWGVGALAANPLEPIPLLPDATARLACVDLDWDNIRSVDILVALRSFLPKGGSITKVTVYPSDYGLERIAEEATSGPKGIWRSSINGHDHDHDDEGTAEEQDNSEDENEVDMERLRLYERSKLRWYYAIVECDSAATANTLYDECDGMEIMKSACKFDLRFVPDDQTFEHRKIRDYATQVPSDYEAPVFQTKALQHTNVELTWDKEDEGRKKALTKKLTADELKDDDFKAYLATDSEDGDSDEMENPGEDPEAVRQRYLRLASLAGTEEIDAKNPKNEDAADDDEVDLEVTFEPGLESLAGRLAAKKEEAGKGGETVWESYIRRKKEKKAEARRLGKHNVDSSDDSDDFSKEEEYTSSDEGGGGSEGDDPFDDPFFQNDDGGVRRESFTQKNKKEKIKAQGKNVRKEKPRQEDDKRRQAELEMLLMDHNELLTDKAAMKTAGRMEDRNDKIGKRVKSMSKSKKSLKRKQADRGDREGSDEEEIGGVHPGGFAVDLEDPRFKGLFASPDFALDPTDPRFAKAGPNAARIASEVAKRRSAIVGAQHQRAAKDAGEMGVLGTTETREPRERKRKESSGSDLKLMVASLKRKAKAAQS